MIRDAVIHLLNEQPLVVDLPSMPVAGDLVLICTNMRTLGRKRPVFVDDSSSTFVFPFAQVRFVEIPEARTSGAGMPELTEVASAEPDEIELDEDLLRRVREL